MGKKIIIKGADFSANGIDNTPYYKLSFKQGYYGNRDGKFYTGGELAPKYISTEQIVQKSTLLKISINEGFLFRLFLYNSEGTFLRCENWSASGEQKTYTLTSNGKFAISIKNTEGSTMRVDDITGIKASY